MTDAATVRAPALRRSGHDLEAFAAGLRGQALWPGDVAYDEACRIWNGMIGAAACTGRPAI
jgi:hypothetical protein